MNHSLYTLHSAEIHTKIANFWQFISLTLSTPLIVCCESPVQYARRRWASVKTGPRPIDNQRNELHTPCELLMQDKCRISAGRIYAMPKTFANGFAQPKCARMRWHTGVEGMISSERNGRERVLSLAEMLVCDSFFSQISMLAFTACTA